MHNPGKSTLYFFATPHVVEPTAAAHRHRFECLCNHKVFQVAPGQYWYRIVRFDLEKDFNKPIVEITHTVVGLSRKDVDENYAEALYDQD